MTAAKGMSVLIHAAAYLGENYGFRAMDAITLLGNLYEQMVADKKAKREILVPVYRMHQPSMVSPCLIGDPCSVCAAHVDCSAGRQCQDCRRGKVLCPRAYPAEPAFTLTFTRALIFVRNGLATFINNNKALRLTFSKIAQLRDFSLKVAERFLIAFADEDRRAVIALEWGWTGKALAGGAKCERITQWTPKALAASREQIQCFR